MNDCEKDSTSMESSGPRLPIMWVMDCTESSAESGGAWPPILNYKIDARVNGLTRRCVFSVIAACLLLIYVNV